MRALPLLGLIGLVLFGLTALSPARAQDASAGVPLVRGLNSVAYVGPATDVVSGTASLVGVVRAIWQFDNGIQRWLVWAPILPEALQGFQDLTPQTAYFVDVSADVYWDFFPADGVRVLAFHFGGGPEGWESGFADLPADFDAAAFELRAEHRPLPAGLVGSGWFLQGHNRSDDLLMFLTRRLSGFAPNTRYTVAFDIDLVTAVQGGGIGIGGAPGESVFVKAGAAGIAPQITVDDLGVLRLNLDVGVQSTDGAHARVLGHIALPEGAATTLEGWGVKRLGIDGRTLDVTTDETGTLWLFVGTDSGFEGLTQLFFSRIGVRIEPAPEPGP